RRPGPEGTVAVSWGWRWLHLFHAIDECLQLAAPRRVTQLAQRLGFNLANALACDLEALAHFFECVLRTIFETEAHLDDALFARRESAQDLRGVFLQVHADHGFGRRYGLAVFDEVTEVRVFFFANRRLQRNRLLRNLQHLAHLRHRNIHAARDLFARRFATQLLHKLTTRADQLVDGFDHVHRDTDGACLVRNGARNRLANPPRGIGR